MLNTNRDITPDLLKPKLNNLFQLAGQKIQMIAKDWGAKDGAPVFTIEGMYTARGWTEWTQGFQIGSALLQFDATGDQWFLDYGRQQTYEKMDPHLTHIGVHDHGFNNVSTYGNLLRLMSEQKIPENTEEKRALERALKISGAIQASRWTKIQNNLGYFCSFSGSHSLFCDSIRSVRSLMLSHQLGHRLMGEQDEPINLLHRGLQHAEAIAQFNVYLGEGRDIYDTRGRVAHETIFNTKNGSFRCPSTQQGYSAFSTWTRGLAWVVSGYAEQLEFLDTLSEDEFENIHFGTMQDKTSVIERFLQIAEATADFYINQTPTDGIPYWDTEAPGLTKMGDYLNVPSDPYNQHEPVDSSSAAITAQGLLRLGLFLKNRGKQQKGENYIQAGLTIAGNLFDSPYLSTDSQHQGLLLHSVYHRPNGWDHVTAGQNIPNNEATMWGDYHGMELGLMILKMDRKEPYYKFY